MANLVDTLVDVYPPASGISLPLGSKLIITFDRLMDEDELQNTVFLEGPDTDQFVGPGLIELNNPNNISQGSLDDFLRSPGYKGVVEGAFEFDEVNNGTRLTFTPERALAPNTEYTVYLMETLDADGNTVSGNASWIFTSGSGSIQEIPSNLSSSVLADLVDKGWVATPTPSTERLSVEKTTPADHSIQWDPGLKEISIDFDKPLDANTVAGRVYVETLPATDHPNAAVEAQGVLVTSLEVSGKTLKVKI